MNKTVASIHTAANQVDSSQRSAVKKRLQFVNVNVFESSDRACVGTIIFYENGVLGFGKNVVQADQRA
jgi:hypothetical protein